MTAGPSDLGSSHWQNPAVSPYASCVEEAYFLLATSALLPSSSAGLKGFTAEP